MSYNQNFVELNKKYSAVLYEKLGSKENVKEYLHFFSWYWWDKNGPTYVVESTDHPQLQRLDLDLGKLGNYHKENDQQKDHVDQGRDADFVTMQLDSFS